MTEKAERTIEQKWFIKTINFGLMAFLAFLFFLISASPADAGNQQITFQGKLTNSSSNTVSDGTYYLKLTIYDASTGGTCQYTASSTCASVTSTPVTVTNGIFSINLGDTSASLAAISPTLFNNSALYLGITVCSGAGVGCDSEMTPRKRLTAAPYAFNADYLSGLATSTIGGSGSYVPVTNSSGNLQITNSLFAATTTAGQFGVGTSTVPSGVKSYVEGTTATDKLLVLRGNSSQSGNLQEWQNSAGTALMAVDFSGNISASGSLRAFANVTSTGHIYPASANTVDLGSSILGFRDIYASSSLYIGNVSGASTTLRGNYLGLTSGVSSTVLNASSLTLGSGTNYSSGMFNVDSNGNVSASGTLAVFDRNSNGLVNISSATLLRINPDPTSPDVMNSLSLASVLSVGDYYDAPGGFLVLKSGGESGILFKNGNDNYAVAQLGISDESGSFQIVFGTGGSNGTTTIDSSQFVLNRQAGFNKGKFYIDPTTGNTSASGTLGVFGATTLNGGVTLGDSVADLITVNGILGTINISNGTTATTTIGRDSLTLGIASGYNSGVFNIDSTGAVNASGTITTASSLVASTVSTVGLTVTGNISAQGNTNLGNSDDAGGDTTRIFGVLSLGGSPTGNAQLFLKASSTTAVPLLFQNESGGTMGQFASSSAKIILNGIQGTLQDFSLLSIGNSTGRPGAITLQADESTTGLFTIYRTATSIGTQLISGSLLLGSGSNTSTLTSNSLIVGQGSGYNQGVFNVNSSGNTSASGTLTSYGSVTLGDSVADLITINGILGTINISNGTTATTTIGRDSLTLGIAANYNAGVFSVNDQGVVKASGTLTALNLASSGSLTVSGNSTFSGYLNPSTDNLYDVGASSTQWRYGNFQQSLLIADGSTTGTLSKDILILGETSGSNLGKFYVDSSGNVTASGSLQGIGTVAAPSLTFTGDTDTGIYSSSAGYIDLAFNGSRKAYFDPVGALSIGNGSVTSSYTANGILSSITTGTFDVGKFYVDLSGNVSSSGTLRVFGNASTGGLQISATNSTTTFTSYSTDGAGAAGFVFTSTITSSSASDGLNRLLFAVQQNAVNKFMVSGGGHAYAAKAFNANYLGYGMNDVAEYVNLTPGEQTEPGDVLVVDLNNPKHYRKSTTAYAKEIAGVISDTGAFVMGASGEGRAALALAGLVNTKVTDENGPINIGDYLVSASQPGYAMKYDSANPPAGGAGLVGMALEPLTEGEGKIAIMVNKGLVAGSNSAVSLTVGENSDGTLSGGENWDMGGKSMVNVLSIKGKENKWLIDEEGYLVMKVKTKQGDRELYTLQTGQDKELVLSGSSQLENGLKKIELPALDQEVIDPAALIKVSVTLTGEAKGVFVSEKSYQGFTVKELGSGTSNATFDWMLIAKRRPADYVESTAVEPESASAEPLAPVMPETASSTSSEEPASAPVAIETPVEPPLDSSFTPEAPAPVVEPVVPPAENPSAPPVE